MSIQTVFRCAMLLCASFCAGGLRAEALVITSDVTNWEGLTLPGAGEEIVIKAGVTAKVTTRAALEAIKDCSRIRPETPTSRFEVQVPAGETWTNFCPMSAVNLAGAGNKDFAKGEIYKTGEGTLCLKADSHLSVGTKVGSLTLYDWWTCLTAAEGHLRLPQDDPDGTHYVGYVTVSNNAVFHVVETNATYFRGLFGGGVVTNDSTTGRNLTIMNQTSVNRDSSFSGQIGGLITFYKYNNGELNLLGTNSTFGGNLTVHSAVLGVTKFGTAGNASSVGRGTTIYLRADQDGEPTLRYLGSGEVSSRELQIYQHATRRAFLDGGATGGLHWNGTIKAATVYDGTMRSLVLTGSNVEECVIGGPVLGDQTRSDNYYSSFYFEKEGSGVWRFADHADRKFASGMAVREGTLRFDSLQEQGSLCALGLATNLTDGSGQAFTPQVPYAFCVGSNGGTAVAPAVLEYSGGKSALCSSRPIALSGDATLRNNTDRRIRLRNVSALGGGADVKMFTLDGRGVNSNEVADVADGAGKVGVRKTGVGTWVLSGDLTFSGPLQVREGSLIVRKTCPGAFTWFRWTIRQLRNESKFCIDKFGVFDAAGKSLMPSAVTYNPYVAELEPAQVGVQAVFDLTFDPASATNTGEIHRMFTWDDDYGWQGWVDVANAHVKPLAYDSSTWIPVVMRAPSGLTADSYDFVNTWRAGGGEKWDVDKYTLEGSVDGLHWTMLTNAPATEASVASWNWAIARRASNSKDKIGVHEDGAKIVGSTDRTYSVLTGNPAVSVAPGATLVADGDLTISKLTLDGENGMGTIDGFEFAENGTIDITGDKAKFLDKAPADIRSATVGKVSNWAVSVNGTLKPGWKVAASADGIKIIKSGMLLLFR